MDLAFDWRYGTDTRRWVDEQELEANSKNQAHSSPYRATKARPLLRLLRQLVLPRDSVFVDIGAGKGRVLLIASHFGFKKVVGIEFSAKLCGIARHNIEIFARRTTLRSPIEVVEIDATSYRFRPEESVLFMYNPFDSRVMAEIVRNIRESLKAHPRKIWLIYNTPQEHAVINAAGLFRTESLYEISGSRFRVYTN